MCPGARSDKREAYGIEQMQRAKLGARIPETRRKRIELIKLAAIGV